MFTTEIDTHCQINAPESSSWNVFRTERPGAHSATAPAGPNPLKWLWILPALATLAAILVATGCLASSQPVNDEARYDGQIHTVVIKCKRMTSQQKLDFDLSTEPELSGT